MESRGTKRARHSIHADPSKRRGPYSSRVCTACRRRKGKCDGQDPCEYCENRGQTCVYLGEGAQRTRSPERYPVSQYKEPSQEHQLRLQSQTPATVNGASSMDVAAPSNVSGTDSHDLTELVASLRAQLNNVEAMVEAQKNGNRDSEPTGSTAPRHSTPTQSSYSRIEPPIVPTRQPQAIQQGRDSSAASQSFYGPTSPDYSMNLVQNTLRQLGYLTSLSHHPMLPSVDSNDAVPSPTSHWQPTRHCDRHQLSQFRSWLSLQEARDAVSTYREVVGELHPFADIEGIEGQLETWYSYGPNQASTGDSQPNDDDLIVLVLILAIAASAQNDTLLTRMASVLHSSLQHSANAAIASCTTSIKQVTIALLLGYYYFSHDMTQLALRLCSTAGRMLMELGFHNKDMLNHVLKADKQRKEACALMCSVIILDRQWSAMTGLPPNFPHTTFDPMASYLGDTPYMKAMYMLILVSERFDEPISLAAKGNNSIDDDVMELLVFQIQQWQKKSVGDRSLSNMDTWLAEPSTLPSPWLVLLIFRAATVRSLLLRPHFFPTSDVEKSKLHIVPAMELALNVTDTLSKLDDATALYRKHRPYYQHILASICALMFLVAGYVEEHRSTMLSHLPAGYDDHIRDCFKTAKKLAEKYADVSISANVLWKRIKELCYAMETYGQGHRHEREVHREPTTSTAPIASASDTPQEAPPSTTEVREKDAAGVGDGFEEVELGSFGASLGLDFSMDGDSSFLQDAQIWGLRGWFTNSHSFLFQ